MSAHRTPRRLLLLVTLTGAAALALLAVALRMGLSVAPHPRSSPPEMSDTSLGALTAPLRGFVSRGLDSAIGHYGVDVAVPRGTAVRAAADGRVLLSDTTREGGLTLILAHLNGLTTIYQHNDRLLVRAGVAVSAGEVIAWSGSTGRLTTGPHLHFEAWRGGHPLDVRALVEDTSKVR